MSLVDGFAPLGRAGNSTSEPRRCAVGLDAAAGLAFTDEPKLTVLVRTVCSKAPKSGSARAADWRNLSTMSDILLSSVYESGFDFSEGAEAGTGE